MRINSIAATYDCGTTNVGGGSGGVRLQSPDDGSCRFGIKLDRYKNTYSIYW